jgi:hypothetical protein
MMMETSSPCLAVLLSEERRPKAENTISPTAIGNPSHAPITTAVGGNPMNRASIKGSQLNNPHIRPKKANRCFALSCARSTARDSSTALELPAKGDHRGPRSTRHPEEVPERGTADE